MSTHTVPIQEVLERTDVSLSALYKAIREEKVPFPVVRIGARIVIPREPFEAVMRGEFVKATSKAA